MSVVFRISLSVVLLSEPLDLFFENECFLFSDRSESDIRSVATCAAAEQNFTAYNLMFYTIPYEMSRVLLNTHRNIRQKNIHTAYACIPVHTFAHVAGNKHI